MEKRVHGIISWNAMMMVTRFNKANDGIGGHISTFASNSHLWEVGQNHYYRGKDLDGWGTTFIGKATQALVYTHELGWKED